MATKQSLNREQLVNKANAAVNKRYGDSTSVSAIDELVDVKVWASTGSLALDWCIGGGMLPGGIPMGPKIGRTIHVFGDPSLGKSALLDSILKSVQDIGGLGMVSEVEGSRDPHFAKAMRMNMKWVGIQKPPTIEHMVDWGLDWATDIRKTNPDIPLLWGVDSITMLQSFKTYGKRMSDEKQAGNFHFGGGKSEALGYALNKITDLCRTSPTTFVLLNQVRESPGVVFGPTKKPTGGLPARFVASVEIELRSSKLGITRDGPRITGKWVHAIIRKNKVRTPHYECDFLINFSGGLSKWGGVFELLEGMKLVHIKRNKDGSIGENEFTITTSPRKGEVLPLTEFTKWVMEDKMLWRPIGAAPPAKEEADGHDSSGESEANAGEGNSGEGEDV